MTSEPNSFVYAPLTAVNRDIRLLSFTSNNGPLQISLSAFNLSDAPSFVALSYVWGETDAPRPTILVNDRILTIQRNCALALRKLRNNNLSQYYWVDAICINQADLHEKAAQVQLMANVFSSAARTAICCGPASEQVEVVVEQMSTERGFDITLKQISWYSDSELSSSPPADRTAGELPWRTTAILEDNHGEHFNSLTGRMRSHLHDYAGDPAHAMAQFAAMVHAAIREIAKSPYWTRLWVVQEVALSTNRVLLGESGAVNMEDFECLLAHFSSTFTVLEAVTKLLSYLPQSSNNQKIPLPTLLRYFGDRQCLDLNDRVYGLLSLAEPSRGTEDIVVDYTISPDVLAGRVLAAWTAGPRRYDVLEDACALYDALLPSWHAVTASNTRVYTERYGDSGAFVRRGPGDARDIALPDAELRVRIWIRFANTIRTCGQISPANARCPAIACIQFPVDHHKQLVRLRAVLFTAVQTGDVIFDVGYVDGGYALAYLIGRPVHGRIRIVGFAASYWSESEGSQEWEVEGLTLGEDGLRLMVESAELMAMLWWCRRAADYKTDWSVLGDQSSGQQ